MSTHISGRNYEVTDKVRDLINSKLEKVRKFLNDIIEVRCVLNVEKYRNICEIMIIGKDYDLKSIQESDSMEDAIQSTVDHLKRQAQKSHEKVKDHHRKDPAAQPQNWRVDVLEPGKLRNEAEDEGDDGSPRIIQTHDIVIRPMSIEQAALTLDDSKNEFIVFSDVDSEKVTVLYKRRDKNFGMIAPGF